jgi:hypothetical protein
MSNTNYNLDQLIKYYKVNIKEIHNWFEKHNIKKKMQSHGIDYYIDDKTGNRLIKWIKKYMDRTWSLSSVAKRINCSTGKFRWWLKVNNINFYALNPDEIKKIEKQYSDVLKARIEFERLKLSPKNISEKYKIDHSILYKWLEENNIKKRGDICGRDYFINDKILKQFLEWFNNRKNIQKPNASGVAKRNGVSRQLVSEWAIINGVKKVGNQYVFTEEQEKMFANRARFKSDNSEQLKND